MKILSVFFLLLGGLCQFNVFSQDQSLVEKTKISKQLVDYFALDRENIHLQLNKSCYLNNEQIWLKGYIIEKKNHLPFSKTSNVYVSLIDSQGVVLKTNLYYAENSSFDGYYKLQENYPTGIYYLHVYTNYMNNFVEDESSKYKINIINPSENTNLDNNKIIYKTAKMEFFPESGIFLEGISNVVGVKIFDCNKNGIEVKNAEVFNQKGDLITNFSTNNMGYGRFEIAQTNNEKYKVVYTLNEQKTENEMPLPALNGIIFSVNNYILPNKTSIKIKTNARSLGEIKSNNYMFVFHKTDESSFLDISFKDDKLEQSILISNDQFSDGINAITLIDKNKTKISERVIYQLSTFKNKLDLSVLKKTRDSVSVSGISNVPFSELSISVVPNETDCAFFEKDIFNSLEFDSNLKTIFRNGSYYLNNTNRIKQLELDNVLICEEYKYDWNNLMKIPNPEKHEFDNGLNVVGTINNAIVKKENYKIKMTSVSQGINNTIGINDKNEFAFENIIALDSTTIHFSLLSKDEKLENLKLYTQLRNNNKKFNKRFETETQSCEIITKKDIVNQTLFPKIRKSISLDSINIIATKAKLKLTNNTRFSNGMSEAFKITDDIAASYTDLLSFISFNGFNVSNQGGIVNISSRATTTFLGSTSPAIFINDAPETDFNLLAGVNLNTIDEIYISKRGYGGGSGASNGVIRIYSKKGFSSINPIKIKSKSLLIQNGFQANKKFKNPKYSSFTDDGFKKFGTIDWKSRILVDENGNFKFSFPNYYDGSVKVIIEGISSEGKILSETRILN